MIIVSENAKQHALLKANHLLVYIFNLEPQRLKLNT